MRKFIISFIVIAIIWQFNLVAQHGKYQDNNMPANGTIVGKVVDSESNQPVEYANISIYSLRDSSLVTGGITNNKGFFQITAVPYGRYYAIIEFIGYSKSKIENFSLKPDNKDINLGTIKIGITAEVLEEAVVEAENVRVEYKLDRKVITPDKDLSAAGGTAVDVLENAPSVQTDIEGNVSLRGSENFLVLIDGRPSPLQGSEALKQIPSSTIQSIEIITNPSAKYEADGVGGIINIILKKDKRQGMNGMFSLSYGSFNSLGGDFLINARTSKFNFFIGANYNSNVNRGESYNLQKTFYNNDTLVIETKTDRNREWANGKLRGGFDYFFTPNDVLTFSGNIGLNKMGGGTQDDITSFWKKNSVVENFKNYKNINSSNNRGLYYSADLNYQHKFAKQGHEISAYAYYDFGSNNNKNSYAEYIFATPDEYRTITKSGSKNLRGQVDYILPIWTNGKFEAGYQAKQRWSANDYHYQILDSDKWRDSTQNDYQFNENIQSGYITVSNEIGKFGFKLGLRTEYTNRFFMPNNNQSINTRYEDFNFFPTAHLSYKLPWETQLMASYSRRINRPWIYFLNPYRNVIDAYNVQVGNPFLESEYTDAVELNIQKKFNKNFISMEMFMRRTTNKFERIKRVDPLNPEIMINTFDNIGKDFSSGVELMANLNLTNWWNFTLSGDGYYYEIIANSPSNRNRSTFTWGARMNNSFKVKKSGTSFQLTGFVRGPSITAQGTTKGMGMLSVGIKQDLLNNKLSITFNLRDILRTMGREFIQDTPMFYSESKMRRKSPTFNISITYRLNDFMRRKDKSDSNQSGGEGMDEM